MTDTYAEAPAPDLRERLDYALGSIADTELATVIATAGLAAVHDEWQRTRVDLAVQEDVARAMALRIAQLTDEARRWKRRWAGAVAQARTEHARGDQAVELLAELVSEFRFGGHPGEPCVRTAWIPAARVARWTAIVEQLQAGTAVTE